MTEYNDMGIPVKTEYELLKAGTYDFVVHGIVSMGLRKPFKETNDSGKKNNPYPSFKFIFELPDSVRDDGVTNVIGTNVTASDYGTGALYRICLAVLGDSINHKFNKKTGVWVMNPELLTFTGLKSLLGGKGQLSIIHREGSNGTYAAIDNTRIIALDPRLPAPKATRETFIFSPMQPDIEVFTNTLTYWTQKDVMTALNVSNFPTELHDAWHKIEENRQSDSSNNETTNTTSNKKYDTSSIE